MRTPHTLCLIAIALLLPTGSAARADVPKWVGGPTFKAHCEVLKKKANCSKCTCKAVTATPSINMTLDATDYTHGLLVELIGDDAKGKPVHQLHVTVGHKDKLWAGGKVLELTGQAGPSGRTDWKLESSKQFFDMCPGACEHDSVGAVHLFEVTRTIVTAKPGADALHEHRERQLTACFERDKQPSCVTLPMGAKSFEVWLPKRGADKKHRPKVRPLGGWSRGWSTGGTSGMQLLLGKPVGKLPKRSPVRKAPRASYFHKLATRPDATLVPR